jgi:hypothetical protein
MQIEKTHHVDCSEPDEDGRYEWYYEYDLFRFVIDDVSFIARSYVDSPDEAHFLRVERGGKPLQLSAEDLEAPLAIAAIRHLRECGKKQIKWLSSAGYEPLRKTA